MLGADVGADSVGKIVGTPAVGSNVGDIMLGDGVLFGAYVDMAEGLLDGKAVEVGAEVAPEM
jgi:hypothetical protein